MVTIKSLDCAKQPYCLKKGVRKKYFLKAILSLSFTIVTRSDFHISTEGLYKKELADCLDCNLQVNSFCRTSHLLVSWSSCAIQTWKRGLLGQLAPQR